LKKKRKLLQQCSQKGIDQRFVFYFQDKSRRTLNVVVNFHHEEKKFVIITAYYMSAISVKGRLHFTQVEFEDWFKKLPTT
jgi:hypothetical protein